VTNYDDRSRLYRTARWKQLRLQILQRDHYRCNRCDVDLRPGNTHPESAVVDHVEKHRGDPVKFFDPDNLQSLCKSCHDRHKQREDNRGYDSTIGSDGWPVDPRHPVNTPRRRRS